ncbi:MAG: GAF domain-containing protein [Solirubrobacteraceae bacterium]|nr:GAF domain-containing protein [Solirubrobacteraceae bacterium]
MTSSDLSRSTPSLGAADTLCHAVSRLVDLAGSVTGAPIAYVWLADAATGPSCSTARPGPRLRAHTQRVAATGRPVVVHDGYAEVDPSQPHFERVVAFVGAPLARDQGSRVHGALCVVDRRPRLWTTEEVATLQTIARAIAGELELMSEA